jgi:protein-disulfide isomerase
MIRNAAIALVLIGCSGGTASQDAAAKPSKSDAAATSAASTAAPGWDPVPAVVARVGGVDITADELDKATASDVVEARVKLYESRKSALDNLVFQRLLDDEAKSKGITVDQLVQNEVQSKITPPTDADVQDFYTKNADRIRGSIDENRDPIRQYLMQQSQQGAMKTYLDGLKEKAKVEVLLVPPRFQVDPGTSPRKGAADAPVQIVEFSDFECPYCGMAAETIKQVQAKYGDKVALTYINFPLPMHPDARPAAEASLCANEKGKFWEYYDKLFANQKLLDSLSLIRYATEVGLDANEFQKCVDEHRFAAQVDADIEKGKSVGMNGTPGFYINGVNLPGAVPIDQFSEVIDAELKAR